MFTSLSKQKTLSFVFAIMMFGAKAQIKETSKTQISLNGTWKFYASNLSPESEVLQEQSIHWDTIQVPGNWDTRKRYAEFSGKGYYKRSFRIPKNWKGKQIRLKFDAVYETAKVWLNGNLIGKHIGGYTPFEFNITKNVSYNSENTIMVMADNTYKRGAWWAWGGISRNVHVKANHDVRIVHQHITAIPDFNSDLVRFRIKYTLENNGSEDLNVQINTEIPEIYKGAEVVIAKKRTTTFSTIAFEKPLSAVKLWHYDSPNLYKLNSSLHSNKTIIDSAKDAFGIRKFEVKGELFYLNNKAVRMNGLNRIHDHPDFGNTEPYSLLISDMADIKSLGANFSRLMHAPLAKDLLRICDSIGFLVIEEIPVWGDDDPQAFPNNPVTKKWMKEMVDRDYNHPSVVAWSVGNELRNPGNDWKNKALTRSQYLYVNDMLDYVKKIDSTRLKTYVTITSYRKGEMGTEPYEKLDFISMNSYGKAPDLVQKTHQKFPGKPIFISEIGKGQIGPAPDAALSNELISYLEALKKFPYVSGVSLWSYNDYRSNYKGTPASGFREWGIVDEKRNRKKAYYQLKEIFSQWQKQ